MNWLASLKTAGVLALSTTQFFARLIYVLSTPLRWLLYQIYAAILFLLSPVWVMLNLGMGTISFSINLVARLKYLYIYLACAAIIGICAGFMLHGTSSFIFVLLGLDSASERRKKLKDQQYSRLQHAPQFSRDDEEKEYDGESSLSGSWRRSEKRQPIPKIDPNDLFEQRWKLIRTPDQPRRRRRGLIGQTIHEESSESDSLVGFM
ncbi:hypothetical protein GGR51DRAFT_495947 [Nemania sp. FL0031]|nr:hypothetical protein GGR51DRAFT_495947 [Nemania sp. FL0031]